MREAKRLQAAATAKYDQAEALLAQYGLADVPAQPTPAPEASRQLNRGVRAMSVASSTTSIKIAEKAPPAPCSRMGGHAQNEGTPTASAVHAFGNEHSGASLNAKAQPWGDATASRSWSGRSAWREYTETKIIKRQRRLSKCRYISSITRYIPRI